MNKYGIDLCKSEITFFFSIASEFGRIRPKTRHALLANASSIVSPNTMTSDETENKKAELMHS